VNLGDNADTTAAVAGGLLGARDGVAAIPARWQERLEYAPPAPSSPPSSPPHLVGAGEAGHSGAREMLQPRHPQ
jgi:ADP-ribosylglycohydrolase